MSGYPVKSDNPVRDTARDLFTGYEWSVVRALDGYTDRYALNLGRLVRRLGYSVARAQVPMAYGLTHLDYGRGWHLPGPVPATLAHPVVLRNGSGAFAVLSQPTMWDLHPAGLYLGPAPSGDDRIAVLLESPEAAASRAQRHPYPWAGPDLGYIDFRPGSDFWSQPTETPKRRAETQDQ